MTMITRRGYFGSCLVIIVVLLRLATADFLLSDIPVIDVSSWISSYPGSSPQTVQDLQQQQREVAEQVARACREIGFFSITGHGVNRSILEAAWHAATEFFDAPDAFKLEFVSDDEASYPYGYERSELLERGKQLGSNLTVNSTGRDFKETFSMGPNNPASGMPPRRFPPSQINFQRALEAYYQEMEILTTTLLQIFAVALKLSTRDWFNDKMDHHMSALRLLNYFPLEVPVAGLSPLDPLVRAGAHTDYGVLTILKTGGSGLQVQSIHSNMSWIDVPHIDDGFVINLGDLMQRWTEDQWVSTVHRVVAVPEQDGMVPRRQAMAYFVNLNGDAVVNPLSGSSKYPPVAAGEYLLAKHLAAMGVVRADYQGAQKDEL